VCQCKLDYSFPADEHGPLGGLLGAQFGASAGEKEPKFEGDLRPGVCKLRKRPQEQQFSVE